MQDHKSKIFDTNVNFLAINIILFQYLPLPKLKQLDLYHLINIFVKLWCGNAIYAQSI